MARRYESVYAFAECPSGHGTAVYMNRTNAGTLYCLTCRRAWTLTARWDDGAWTFVYGREEAY